MTGKFRKGEKTVKEILQAILELTNWQAQLAREALRKLAARSGKRGAAGPTGRA